MRLTIEDVELRVGDRIIVRWPEEKGRPETSRLCEIIGFASGTVQVRSLDTEGFTWTPWQ